MSKLLSKLFLILIVFKTSVAYSDEGYKPKKETRLVCEIQERLSDLGFTPGSIDGQVGDKTRNAVGLFLSEVKPKGKSFSVEEVVNYLRAYQSEVSSNSVQAKEIIAQSRPGNGKVFFKIEGLRWLPFK